VKLPAATTGCGGFVDGQRSAPSCAQMQMQVLWDVQTSPAEI
jgi:hypothetical protein